MTLWIGVVLAGVGLGLRLWALRALLAAGLSEHQILSPARPASYTDEGPYLFLDHPAYWGSLLFLAGIGVANLVPIMFSAAGNYPGHASGTAISTVTMVGYAGILIAPSSIGWVAEHIGYRPTYGALSVLIQAGYEVKLVRSLPGSVFYPPPEVESVAVQLTPRAQARVRRRPAAV